MKKEKILIVDDVEINRLILREILSEEYETEEADRGTDAVAMMLSGSFLPSIVLLDIMMPEMDGYEVLEIMKSNVLTQNTPVIFITAADSETNETKGLSMGAVDYISKPFNPEVVKVRVSHHLRLKNYSDSLEIMVEKKVSELTKTKEKMLETMANIIEYRNLESGHHVKRTRGLTKILVDFLYAHPEYGRRITSIEQHLIVKAVPLHDVGKIAIPDSILLKPGSLTREEFEVIKTHTSIGSDIIKLMLEGDDDQYLKHCYDICRYHHERWDGKGYPDGLKDENIPLSARILAVVDVYDALVSPRVYKPPFSHEEAIEIIAKGPGTQFDPAVTEALMVVHREFERFEVEVNS